MRPSGVERHWLFGLLLVFFLSWAARSLFFPSLLHSDLPHPGVVASSVPELTVSTYRTFTSPSGLGPVLFPLFEKQCQCRVRVLSLDDGGAIVARLEMDRRRGKVSTQVVLGLDQYLWERAKPYLENEGEWVPQGYARIESGLKLAPGFLPYDYGVLSLIVDQKALEEKGLTIPRSLFDLLNVGWKRHLLLQDPRTSTPGLTFLLYTRAVLGESKSIILFLSNVESNKG